MHTTLTNTGRARAALVWALHQDASEPQHGDILGPRLQERPSQVPLRPYLGSAIIPRSLPGSRSAVVALSVLGVAWQVRMAQMTTQTHHGLGHALPLDLAITPPDTPRARPQSMT